MNIATNQRKIVIVTGGSRGIGKSIALNAAKRGLDVILTYNNNRKQGEAVISAIKSIGQKAVALKLDASDMTAVMEFGNIVKETLQKEWNREQFDFLVNNAGIAQRSSIKDTTEVIFDQLVNVNFKGVFFLTQQLIPLITDGGQIINISSGLARFAFPGVAVYGALKAGVEALTRYFAKEYADRKIRVNTIAPGAIDTEFGGGKGDEAHRQQIAAQIALGRLGTAEDVGLFIASMLSDDSSYITAQRIEISGGIMI